MTQPLVDLTGRHAVITGGAGGLGRAVADVFTSANATITLLDLPAADPEAAAAKFSAAGAAAAGRACDVTDPAQVAAAFDWAESTSGRPDILVNNAGINRRGTSLGITEAEWDQTFAVNLKGYYHCARQLAQRLLDSDQAGSIVNVSSIGGVSSLGRGNFSYGITKAGVNQLTRELAVVWGRHGIRVNAVAPGQIATEGLKRLSERPSEEGHLLDTFLRGIPLGRLVEPSEVAAAVAFLASDAASMINGVVLPVDGGNLALNAGGTSGEGRRACVSRVELKVPSYGMADTESVVVAWLREPGEMVDEGDPVVSIDTAKTEVTLESPAAGVLGPHLFGVDAEVGTGAVLTWVEASE